ncbi:GyrI-like domain-containing protein [Candidatus Gracilibacteria bacterium]|nr:GyrI-like domain-containing protein [Candidatus Gracilibacteria bacterium]NJS41229.1 GyrI-like domain-containing protein [Candidatus Gracilibacteria bacterium]
MSTKLKEGYYFKKIDTKLATMRGFFIMFRPFRVPYDKIANVLQEKKVKIDHKLGMFESAPVFGWGWIGMSTEKDVEGMKTKQVLGDFVAFDYKGSYKGLPQAWRQIMKDYPNGCEYYSIYVNNPNKVNEEDLLTTIIFKLKQS